ncbi:glutamate receptor ionotropic, delta-1-like [Pollicipes pollicipes]|uniref:glutamate receptor ionotropic, delta-1-like n=1 Tax=Pollicipes pollicipes TaxID=41117 RepID=UPI0018855B49|nr:glutamate receptor ionotropic, delta-1-like [Pollicipes pollicipes]
MPTAAYLNSTQPDRWSFRVINILASVYNFTPEYVPSANPSGGVPDAAGGWGGLTGQLLREEVDMTGNFLVSSTERLDLVSFGETIGYSQIGLLIERPKAETRDDSLLAPFSNKVWIMILISMLVMGPLIWGIIRFRVWLATSDKHLNRIIPLGSCVWFVYGALMKQGSVLSPVTDSSRMLFATWWIFITVVTAFYTANLTAYMTFSDLKIPVDSIDDIDSNQKSWIAPRGDSIQMYVNSSDVLMGMRRAGKGSFISPDAPASKTIDKVRSSAYVYIDEVSKLNAMMMADYYYSSNRTCHVYVVPLKDEYIKYSLAAPKGSSFNQAFDPFVHWLVMSGIANKWKRDAEVDAAPCAIPKGIQGTKLMNEELRMIYYILLTSYGCGVALLMLEIGWGRLARRCGSFSRQDDANTVLQRVLRPDGAGAGKSAWAVTRPDQKPTTTYTYGMSMDRGAVSTWSTVTTRCATASSTSTGGRTCSSARGDGVRPVPVTDDKNEVFERIFRELKERPGSSRLNDQFGDLYLPENLMHK